MTKSARHVEELDTEHLRLLGYEGAKYEFYEDDGFGKDYENPQYYRVLRKQ